MKNLILIIFCILATATFSQNSYDIDQRKGKLFFSLGTELRPVPFRSKNAVYNSRFSMASNGDAQSSGMAFSYSFDFFINKNLAIGFSQSVRYDLITVPLDEITDSFGVRPANNDLIFDYHLYLDYHFKIFKNSEIFARIGISFLNRGTEFVSKRSFFDNNGNLMFSRLNSMDAAYEPGNFALGYKKNKTSLMIGMYSSTISEYLVGSTYIIPYVGFRYNLG